MHFRNNLTYLLTYLLAYLEADTTETNSYWSSAKKQEIHQCTEINKIAALKAYIPPFPKITKNGFSTK